jgi:hypothetical protein
MTQRTLTADIIAAEAITILDNELVMAKQVFRGYEDDFSKKVNGYKVGETISIRKPTDFTVRDGAVMAVQEVNEGKTTITVDKRKGIDFEFTSQELTLDIAELSERVIKPAMIQLANQVDTSTRTSRPGLALPPLRSTPIPTSPRRPSAWTNMRFLRSASASSRRPIIGACSARRLLSICRTWPRAPIARAL